METISNIKTLNCITFGMRYNEDNFLDSVEVIVPYITKAIVRKFVKETCYFDADTILFKITLKEDLSFKDFIIICENFKKQKIMKIYSHDKKGVLVKNDNDTHNYYPWNKEFGLLIFNLKNKSKRDWKICMSDYQKKSQKIILG
jgi:hypothetical protein